MKSGWADPEHVGKITISILNALSGEFHRQNKKKEDEKDYDLIIKLSQAAGYQAQLYSGLQKSHEFNRRLQRIEKDLQVVKPEDFALSQNPVIAAEEKLKTDYALR